MKRLGEAICLLSIQMEAGEYFYSNPWSSSFCVQRTGYKSLTWRSLFLPTLWCARQKLSNNTGKFPTGKRAVHLDTSFQSTLACAFPTIFPITWDTLIWICMALIRCVFTKDTHPELERLCVDAFSSQSSPMHRWTTSLVQPACVAMWRESHVPPPG